MNTMLQIFDWSEVIVKPQVAIFFKAASHVNQSRRDWTKRQRPAAQSQTTESILWVNPRLPQISSLFKHHIHHYSSLLTI